MTSMARKKRGKPRRDRWFRRVAFLGIAGASLALAGALLWPLLPGIPPGPGGDATGEPGRTIRMTISMGGFDPYEIRVRAGETVVLKIWNPDSPYHIDGGGQHQFAIDELGINLMIPPRSTRVLTFKADRPGVFTFYCDVCCGGRANPAMVGKLIVEG
ncbi:Nitrous-oxide reductase [Candidatus Thermoflexus japonica]|uniref:Nitrous-oxide reductase n=1 Tax=Candidatus Thermoflexus japonica TaxID=2035417 RepID=A0A2H5Y323_9CHLR|nr:Nitrous-oxide reductase [Candidatus Thermoflexus japonica]